MVMISIFISKRRRPFGIHSGWEPVGTEKWRVGYLGCISFSTARSREAESETYTVSRGRIIMAR